MNGKTYRYFDLTALGAQYGEFYHVYPHYHDMAIICYICLADKLPYSIRVLLESAVRNCDNFQVTTGDVESILNWEKNQAKEDGIEVAFKPARVILQVL